MLALVCRVFFNITYQFLVLNNIVNDSVKLVSEGGSDDPGSVEMLPSTVFDKKIKHKLN